MKTKSRILLAGAVLAVMILGAWNGVFAAGGARPGNTSSAIHQLLAPFFQQEVSANDVTETPEATEIHQAGDNAARPEPGLTPDTADDAASPVETSGEATGTVTAITGTTITINGQLFSLTSSSEGAAQVKLGDTVKLEFTTNPDGTLVVREISGDSSSDASIGHDGNDDSGNLQQDDGSSSGSDSHNGGDDRGGDRSGG